ncbi:flagellar hook-associated protein 2 [Bacillus sp. OxB-1]|uniref:flagellar filament capping protein FliD n=1 Tax=Bacillus sp. (strain OxB-1) TaxID=98228 RepID=UPI00058233A8|nr:flagellar filament capping protein FliD [Bacillus sp. OxB-1]BAQ10209.1 flagellar hook-associated protein 2 [Bacillus sp. OxB-1]
MRISGLATGMDTESIIRDMMKAHRIPLDKITQKKQYLEWQLDDYRSINRNLKSQSDKLFDTVMKQGNYLQKAVTVSNTDAVNIRALNATSDFSGTLAVHQLAKQATLQGEGITKGDNTSTYTDEEIKTLKLSELDFATGEIDISIQVPGESSPKKLTFTADDTISKVLKRINEETGVSAFYDAHTGKIAMTAKKSGGSETDNIIQVNGDLAGHLKLNGNGAAVQKGQNAIFTFNGLQTERSSNTFQINGFEINLKQVTDPPVKNELGEDTYPTTNAITFSSAPNTDKIVDSVVQFVNDYNKMIEELNAKIREPKYRNFQPLSDEQKKEMKEKEIELWEEKAKSGTLRNDPTVSSMLSQLRTIMSSPVTIEEGPPEQKMMLSDIGISMSKSYTDNGKLTIDEDKLREAIATNPENIYKLIGRADNEATDTKDNSGIAVKYRKVLQSAESDIKKKAGSAGAVNDTFTLGRSLKDMNNQIERFEDRLKMTEDRYWRQFTAMERAIQRANAQSAQLMSSFGGGM